MSLGKTLLIRKTITTMRNSVTIDSASRRSTYRVMCLLSPVCTRGGAPWRAAPRGRTSTQTVAAWSRNIWPSAETRTPVNLFEYPEM